MWGKRPDNPFPILCGTSAGAINAVALAVFATAVSTPGCASWPHLAQLSRRADLSRRHPGHRRVGAALGSAIFYRLADPPVAALAARQRPLRALLGAPGFLGRSAGPSPTATWAVTVTASGYTSGESLSFFQGGTISSPGGRPSASAPQPTQVGPPDGLQRDPLRVSGGAHQPRIFRRRLDAAAGAISPVIHLGAERILVIAGGRCSGGAPARRRLSLAGPGGGPRHVEHLPRRAVVRPRNAWSGSTPRSLPTPAQLRRGHGIPRGPSRFW